MLTTPQRHGRFGYRRLDSNCECRFVIVDFSEDPLEGLTMDFFDQEYGEVRWHRFEPGHVEREGVKRLLAEQRGGLEMDGVFIDVEELQQREVVSDGGFRRRHGYSDTISCVVARLSRQIVVHQKRRRMSSNSLKYSKMPQKPNNNR
jgi:hypothetical protein